MEEKQKVWMVYGGESGVGAAAVRFILSRGDFVIFLLTEINPEDEGKALLHQNLEYVAMPSADKHTIHTILEGVLKRHSTIDALVSHGVLTECYMRSTLRLLQGVLPYMLPRLSGQIIFISSEKQMPHTPIDRNRQIFRLFDSFIQNNAPELEKIGISVSNFLPSYPIEGVNDVRGN